MKCTVVIVNKSKCAPQACGDFLCMRFCPRNRAGDECIIKTPDDKVAVNEEVCISCGICVKKCPFKALDVVNTPQELKQEPVHQYAKNAFRLYGLPMPKKNEIIGLLGANGIGKSTAINILSGNLRPNLGKYEAKITDKEILDFFQGSETYTFFKNKFIGNHSLAYKPQYVEVIPKTHQGTVKELLTKACNKDNMELIIKELELTKILDTPINQVSGGELQRIAIAACLVKKANTYLFDEPSSYLDIKQRLKIAGILQKLKSLENSVFIVEHDLIMLDFMTDFVHVFYGSKGAFGITSFPYTTREGINAYLKGYLQNENMRFREKPIIYDIKGAETSINRDVNNTWEKMNKKLGNFNININEGELYEGEVVGVVGPNGIGKTTFARLLAGEIDADSGSIDKKVKISYKPQYIKAEHKMKVYELLKMCPLYETYKPYFVHLDIDSLIEKDLTELSGGELQRVSVAACLSRDADIYLLDEPSAHLDVEQRIQVAKALKEIIRARKKCAIVIDHDLMFIDYVSERLIVFTGEPAINGITKGPLNMREGMNLFLKELGLTFRRDETSHRPRPNKTDSVKDREQKQSGEYYYT